MSSPAPRVTVVIPTWNGLQHLPECLSALTAQTFSAFRVIVVDNASTDASADWLHEQYPQVQVIARSDNGGFARAVNAGILASDTEYVALLNNDTAAEPRWLEALVRALDEQPAYDLAASMMLLYYQPSRLNAAGDVYVLWRFAGRNRGFGRPLSRYLRRERVLGACAGAALYRRTLFRDVGLFDEDFFLMSEDTDFNLRCLIAGKRCLYVPEARVRHKYRASVGAEPEQRMSLLALRNEALVAAKNMPAALLLPVLPLFIPYRLLQRLALRPLNWHLIPGRLRLFPRAWRAEAQGLRLGLAKRGPVWRRQAVGTGEIIRWLVKGSGAA